MCWSRVPRLGVAVGLLVAGVPSWASESDRAFAACVASMGVPVLKRTRIGEESKSETVVLSGRVGADGRVKLAEDRGGPVKVCTMTIPIAMGKPGRIDRMAAERDVSG